MANSSPTSFPIMEHFYTIQGEGRNAGKASYFFRIGGCDVGCPWCDVKESWDDGHPKMTIQEIINCASEAEAKNIVITGGEPCMYDLSELTSKLKSAGFNLWIETSGAYEITGDWDWIVVSPKRRKSCLPSSLKKASELKVVVVRTMDFDWAVEHAKSVSSECALYFQPEWSREEEMLPEVINFVKGNPDWQISLQTHKYMQIP
ncbi:7-carboxy-7-deazaguanine synthase QueE [Salibacteraceae bacterium]|jgi:7-carboxy-7-deazaguanine synthase|nr:7-carboxy-7-deazaguanine synthase QueE [Crocinitomicaceae bacterium]MCH9823173.1 7-carboxy-7-deazaguanine synthase QueE [Bacteroidota bacterium]MDA7730544.1 7-carboxy-7-deazaguanine synthase QueE [Salibacteraceae bacterium]MDA9938176.1 7-carboxy-7-deazaguanine synthase QueE [Salibacteraceae bacterium]MDA9968097.1 7-carboxy-7-deazaguanine synthase QueE [Salibacteraceae bacterium]|tara:strand:- start:33711 stop:34322 length:612 start_codon:yes stop_codon:yes gene_type:complete